MSKFCGLCSSYKPLRRKPRAADTPERDGPNTQILHTARSTETTILNRKSADFAWAREDQLSVILEVDSTRNTPKWEKTEAATLNWERLPRVPNFANRIYSLERRSSFESLGSERSDRGLFERRDYRGRFERMSDRMEARPIQPPPRDLESIARIDKSLVFEHFTTEDAWLLGSALRERLLPIPTPVVINISLANQNQTLFHTCTHSGVMPDNDSWVARKRKTVLRWGVSTWYMSCKFEGDEAAFRDKYGLGNSAGEYAIHGGGVPIRVTGVEGVVAVVVVSGLKQDEDHAVVVEVIRELYY